MRYLVTSAEMKRYDQNCIEKIGIPSMVLMERAALETFHVLQGKGLVKADERAFILAGYGNNGGDGLALARMLCEAGMIAEVLLVGNAAKATTQWLSQKAILGNYPVRFVKEAGSKEYIVVIDALFGVGLKRELEGDAARAVELANTLKGTKVALDVPSGVDSNTGKILGTAFQADLTVTYGFEKKGLYLWPGFDEAGEVVCADVGISKSAFFGDEPSCFALDESLAELLPARKKNGNKGTFGKALIIAGSYNVAGAAILCGRACYKLGAGMVKIMSDAQNRVILQESLPEALLGDLADQNALTESGSWCDVICIGPGLGKGSEAKEALREVLLGEAFRGKPLVIDADGLNLLSEDETLRDAVQKQGREGRSITLTPHPGELRRLSDAIWQGRWEMIAGSDANPLEQIGMELAKYFSATIVAKDARSFVCREGRATCMNLSGNGGMATAGSGDVLAGIITAFLCQEKKKSLAYSDDFLVICRAVRVHGLLGDLAKEKGLLGEHGVMAGDIVE